ncbi:MULTISPECIES: AAA-like domain-containing protein [Calothrix]|uniref:AAA-like domain-containing protein n=2 Tax=Calothrix TaxID=1186 RepID=A0ABR8ACE0_9CYAN|nr:MULTISPECIES: AAA-like domain-containing protein [Calothrix]MBD2197676.1 AAA-like domain-containing protein [Calothrix parietina FACHB-288]MBD2225605.1 AAA-like domain-containing protein [Calothrix anomala FACHB-343]
MRNFNLDEAIQIANKLTYKTFQRNLTDVEIIILKGAWNREEYDAIAAKYQYATSYISQDVAPKLWKTLTEALGEKVRKSNFKEALKRHWQEYIYQENIEQEFPSNISSINFNLIKNEEKFQNSNSSENQQNFIPNIYVERHNIESICYETVKQPGSLIRIKAPSLMGKTYLIDKILSEAAQDKYRTVSLSFELADSSTHFNNLNKFLRWFCINISRELGLASELDEYWDEEGMGAKVSCTTFFEEYLLAQADTPLVLCLDDVDILFPYPEIYEDFFGLLRSWYEKARSRKVWKKLRLVIAHSTNVYIRLNINQSPFNVGLPIELPEFTHEQVISLVHQHSLNIDAKTIESLMQLVGGHPYLLEQAFIYMKIYPQVTITQILEQAATDAGIYSHHLREQWLNLQQHPELAAAFKKVIVSPIPIQIEPVLAYQLQSIGLVRLLGNKVEPRCQLYSQYFSQHLSHI